MQRFPKEPKKIAELIRRYEAALRKEFKRFGGLDDSDGKRYLLGPLYLTLGDVKGAHKSYRWLEKVVPDDAGEPFDTLCWALTLYRTGELEAASKKLLQTMLCNLYLLPALIGAEQARLDIWHSSTWDEKSYVQSGPAEIFALWDEVALDWVRQMVQSPQFRAARDRYIAIYRQLQSEPVGPKRSQLVQEAFQLIKG